MGAHAAGCLAVALPDPRFPANKAALLELQPRWMLDDGIGTFDATWIVKKAPTMLKSVESKNAAADASESGEKSIPAPAGA